MSHQSVLQERPPRASYRRMSYKSVLQKCSARVPKAECLTGVSQRSVFKECSTRLAPVSWKTFLQECHARLSNESVPPEEYCTGVPYKSVTPIFSTKRSCGSVFKKRPRRVFHESVLKERFERVPPKSVNKKRHTRVSPRVSCKNLFPGHLVVACLPQAIPRGSVKFLSCPFPACAKEQRRQERKRTRIRTHF